MPSSNKYSAQAESALKQVNAVDLRHELDLSTSIVALCSICESYADSVLDARISASIDPHSQFQRLMVEELRDRFHGTWDDRLKWLCQGFQIANKGDGPIQSMLTLVDLRNAIVHGNGQLTHLQTRKGLSRQLTLERELRQRLDVTVEARTIRYGDLTRSRATAICRSFILTLNH